MPFPPKKQGLGIMIAVGKPQEGPPALDTPGKKSEPPVAGPKSEPEVEPKAEPKAEPAAKGLDFDAIGQNLGVHPDDVKMVAKAVLEHLLTMCGGDEHEQVEHDMGGADLEGSGDEDYPA